MALTLATFNVKDFFDSPQNRPVLAQKTEEIAAQLTRDNPDLKVILTSGYAPELIENELEGQRPVFIQKPYPPGLLSSTVGKCLGI